jgi:hypothetical protein
MGHNTHGRFSILLNTSSYQPLIGTRLDRIASGTARRAAKSKFGLFSIVITQRFHIFKIKIDSFIYWDIFYMYHYKNYDRNMLVAFYSSEKSLHLIMA